MEKKFFLILLLLVAVILAQSAVIPNQSGQCGKRYHGNTKVVDGQTAQPHSWPWQVSLRKVNSVFHFCGGSLINDQWVVTAAHCVPKVTSPQSIYVTLGEHDQSVHETATITRTVDQIIVHPSYGNFDNDIALLKLTTPVPFSQEISPVCLPSQGNSVDENTGKECYITGWGRTRHDQPGATVLQEAKLPVISNVNCRSYMGSTVTDRMVCAGFGGASTVSGCMGDSGGPFVCRDTPTDAWYLHGAVSWGTRKCSDENDKFTVFARVSEFVDWIKQHVGSGPQPPNPTPPMPTTLRPPLPPSTSADCNFDQNDRCSFSNVVVGTVFNWTTAKNTASSDTGPGQDAGSSGTGYFLYTEASSPRVDGDMAAVRSPVLSGPQCLRFFYHMYGSDIGTLKVLVEDTGEVLMEVQGDQGNQWIETERSISVNGDYQVEFQGIIGPSFQSDIAIDEITFTPGLCGATGTCNFDNGNICDSFNNANDDDFDWIVNSGSTPSSNTGPSKDVSGQGSYIYIETSSPRVMDEMARLNTSWISGPHCLTFYYHMYGVDTGTLNVYISTSCSNSKVKIYSVSGNQGNKWMKSPPLDILDQTDKQFQIVFEGVCGKSWGGDIALDVIALTAGNCETVTPSTTQPTQPPSSASSTTKLPTQPTTQPTTQSTTQPTTQPTTQSTQSPPSCTSKPPSGSCGQKGYGLSDNQRIVGGQQATPGEWPWQVALLSGSFQFCGGSLVSNQYVITAAHCVTADDWSKVTIRLGEHNIKINEGKELDIKIAQNGITPHSLYDKATTDYDIAIIKLSQPVQFSKAIKPICINKNIDFTGKHCYITGWGRLASGGLSPDILQEAQVPIVNRGDCEKSYSSGSITDRMFCAGYSKGGTDSCQGDSGGPLVCQHSDGSWYLAGITSWGKGCALAGYYGVYSHVANLGQWINQQTGL